MVLQENGTRRGGLAQRPHTSTEEALGWRP